MSSPLMACDQGFCRQSLKTLNTSITTRISSAQQRPAGSGHSSVLVQTGPEGPHCTWPHQVHSDRLDRRGKCTSAEKWYSDRSTQAKNVCFVFFKHKFQNTQISKPHVQRKGQTSRSDKDPGKKDQAKSQEFNVTKRDRRPFCLLEKVSHLFLTMLFSTHTHLPLLRENRPVTTFCGFCGKTL